MSRTWTREVKTRISKNVTLVHGGGKYIRNIELRFLMAELNSKDWILFFYGGIKREWIELFFYGGNKLEWLNSVFLYGGIKRETFYTIA